MNPALKQLYKQTLIEHSKAPRNNHPLPDSACATIRNPLCGDEITVYLKSDDVHSCQLAFTAQACSICMASASMMTQRLTNLSTPEIHAIASDFVSNFKNNSEAAGLEGDLAALTGVSAFPSRIRCATLPWEALLKIDKRRF